jgi:SNF2 family DNA or RNA helicase
MKFASERFYYSELGLFPFQEEGVAHAAVRKDMLAVWDTGIGKTHLGMATAALLFELEEIDVCLVVCEANKVDEWIEDFEKFTDLGPAFKYKGAKRSERLRAAEPLVVITTYETMRESAVAFIKEPGKYGAVVRDGEILPWLRKKRIFVIYDEVTKLRNRTSNLYKAHAFMLKNLRKARGARVLALTATPMDTSPENLFNIVRLVRPDVAGTVKDFENRYTFGRDDYGNLKWNRHELPRFAKQVRPAILRKRKSDPDVIDQFPRQIEDSLKVPLLPVHREFVKAVEQMVVGDHLRGGHFMVNRMVAGYPASLEEAFKNANERDPGSAGILCSQILREVGEAGLRDIPSSKAMRLIEYLTPLVKGQGEKVLIFTFFGPTIGKLLARDFRESGFQVFQHFPPLSAELRSENKRAFRAYDGPAILLSSDAGARGMNIPEASYVVHYDMPLTFATYRQRTDRNHRIDSKLPSVTSTAMIALETVEEDIGEMCMSRNETQDILIEDVLDAENYVLALERRKMLRL